MVDAVGIEPTTCRLRVARKPISAGYCICLWSSQTHSKKEVNETLRSPQLPRFTVKSPWYFPRYDFQPIPCPDGGLAARSIEVVDPGIGGALNHAAVRRDHAAESHRGHLQPRAAQYFVVEFHC